MVETNDLFDELNDRPWRFGVRLALEFLQEGRPDDAKAVLEDLIEHTKDGKELPKWDVRVRLRKLLEADNDQRT